MEYEIHLLDKEMAKAVRDARILVGDYFAGAGFNDSQASECYLEVLVPTARRDLLVRGKISHLKNTHSPGRVCRLMLEHRQTHAEA